MQMQVVTIFPEMVRTIAQFGVVGRAVERELIRLDCQNPRDFTLDAHRTIDDRPYGGWPGMVMKYEPAAAAIAAAKAKLPAGSPVVCMSPQGAVFDQAMAQRFARHASPLTTSQDYGQPSPEQARGQPVTGARTSGPSSSCSGTGRPLFTGESISDILAGVLKVSPFAQASILEPSSVRNCLIHAGWAGHAGALTRF